MSQNNRVDFCGVWLLHGKNDYTSFKNMVDNPILANTASKDVSYIIPFIRQLGQHYDPYLWEKYVRIDKSISSKHVKCLNKLYLCYKDLPWYFYSLTNDIETHCKGNQDFRHHCAQITLALRDVYRMFFGLDLAYGTCQKYFSEMSGYYTNEIDFNINFWMFIMDDMYQLSYWYLK